MNDVSNFTHSASGRMDATAQQATTVCLYEMFCWFCSFTFEGRLAHMQCN